MGKDRIVSSVDFRRAAVFCLLVVGIISLGVFYYRYGAQRITDGKYEDLSAVTKLKSDSIQDWRRHRLADVRSTSLGPLVRREIARLLQDPMNPSARRELQIELNINRKESVYEDVLFLDARGNILLSDNPNPAPVDQATIKAIEVALKDRKEVLSDFFRAPKGSIYIDALAPILDNSGQPIAIVVLRSNAADFLYPVIQTWPTPSRTAETLLVCRDGDSILFLNELRHRSKTALTLRSSLTDTQLPGVQAVLGNYGRFLGRDYRGVDVLAVSQPVPQSPWFIVAKVDVDQILAEVRYRAGVVAIIVFLLILISAGLLISVYRKRQEVERKQAEEVVRGSESRYKELFNNISSGVAIYEVREDGADFVFKDFNKAGERIDGCKKEDLIGKSIFEVRPGIKEFGLLDVFRRVWETGIPEHFPVALYKDAMLTHWYENFVYKLPSGEIVAVFDDISERKRAADALRASDERYRSLYDEAPVGYMELGTEGRITKVNRRELEMLGYSAGEMLGLPVWNFLVEKEATRELIKAKLAGTKPCSSGLERTYRRKDGTTIPVLIDDLILKDKNGRIIGIRSTIQDITERKRMEEEARRLHRTVQEERDKLFGLVNSMLDEVWFTDMEKRFTLANPAALSEFGLDRAEGIDVEKFEKSLEVYRPDGSPCPVEEAPPLRALAGEVVKNQEQIIRTPRSGELRYRQVNATPVKDTTGRVIGAVSVVRDITESKRAEEALRETKDYLENLIDHANAPIIVWDPLLRITRFNRAFESLTGQTADEVIGKSLESLFPSDQATKSMALIEKTQTGERWKEVEIGIRHLDGSVRTVLWNSATIFASDGKTPMATIAQGHDITARKLAEEQLKASLEEKKVLLREIHHRVKNNMQVIISLLRLQAEQIGETRYADMLKESQARIKTMAFIHERLYQAKDFANVNFDEYVESIVNGLFRSYGVNTEQIILRIKVQDVSLDLENAIPCGLIINELVSNSLKHAFPQGRKGEIRISLRSIGMDEIELILGDDGVGIPEDLDIEKTDSLGLHLVSILVEHQLGGKIDLTREGGTEYRILFRRQTDKGRTQNNGKSANFDSGR